MSCIFLFCNVGCRPRRRQGVFGAELQKICVFGGNSCSRRTSVKEVLSMYEYSKMAYNVGGFVLLFVS